MFVEQFDCDRLFLTAVRLELTHPLTEKRLKIETSLDPDIETVIRTIGLLTTPRAK